MPKYFFHIRDGNNFEIDTVGTHFPTLELAVSDAKLAAREIIAEKLMAGDRLDGQCFEITDEAGRVVDTVPFRSVINLH